MYVQYLLQKWISNKLIELKVYHCEWLAVCNSTVHQNHNHVHYFFAIEKNTLLHDVLSVCVLSERQNSWFKRINCEQSDWFDSSLV